MGECSGVTGPEDSEEVMSVHLHTDAVRREVQNADQKTCFISDADTVNGVAFHDMLL